MQTHTRRLTTPKKACKRGSFRERLMDSNPRPSAWQAEPEATPIGRIYLQMSAFVAKGGG
jgi:hypothetical protein